MCVCKMELTICSLQPEKDLVRDLSFPLTSAMKTPKPNPEFILLFNKLTGFLPVVFSKNTRNGISQIWDEGKNATKCNGHEFCEWSMKAFDLNVHWGDCTQIIRWNAQKCHVFHIHFYIYFQNFRLKHTLTHMHAPEAWNQSHLTAFPL